LGKITGDFDGRLATNQETTLGDFVADALRNTCGADIAVIHATTFTKDVLITTGVVDEQTMRDSLTSPTSPVVILQLQPALLRKMMERAVSKAPDAHNAYLQVSGMVVTYNRRKPAGSRVERIVVAGKTLDFLDDKTTLTVAMPLQLGNGGAGYLSVFPREVINAMKTTETTLLDAVKSEFVRLNGVVRPATDGRLKDTGA
jgi:5'-nucleotidase